MELGSSGCDWQEAVLSTGHHISYMTLCTFSFLLKLLYAHIIQALDLQIYTNLKSSRN
jgi:hypothetical protein